MFGDDEVEKSRGNEVMDSDYPEYEQYEQMIAKDRLDGFLKYFSTGAETLSRSFNEDSNGVYLALDILLFEYYSGAGFIGAGCMTLFDTWAETTYDIESSIYLAFSGRYASANAILRRVFEIKLTSLYFDTLIHKTDADHKSQVMMQLNDWMSKGQEPLKFAADGGIIDSVFENIQSIDAEIDAQVYFAGRELAKSLYGDLSKFVHKGLPMPEDRLLQLDFTEYQKSDFSAWLENLKQMQRIFVVLLVHHFPDFVKHYCDEQEKVEPQDHADIIH
jgi:hypothetical protein